MARIVVAENDPDALDLIALDLRLEGHDVIGVFDANAALAIVGDFRPDIVVLDYRMPGLNGLDAATRLLADHGELHVIIYSNYQSIDVVRRARENGITFLPKGNLRALRAALRS